MDEARWLDADEQRAWRAFQGLRSRLGGRLHRQLQADSGLSLTDYEVLVALTDTPEHRLRPVELQGLLQWEQSRLSHHLTRMERRDLVRRTRCADDRRGSYVELTTAGREAIEAAAPGHVAAVRRWFFDPLTREQVAALEELVTRILRRLDDPS